MMFDTYDVREGETPEMIAHKLYGDAELHWIVCMTNDIVNRFHDWPMNTNQFLSYVRDKYDNPTLYIIMKLLKHLVIRLLKLMWELPMQIILRPQL